MRAGMSLSDPMRPVFLCLGAVAAFVGTGMVYVLS